MTFQIEFQKRLVDDLNGCNSTNTDVQIILSRCRKILHIAPNSLISFARRQANNVTHKLARASMSLIIFQIVFNMLF
ncbi:hypothetical protein GYH30_033437 [Glycine max]|uniref:RNase H type-1 domain-containing protein n=2 Tax=Glycine subgen. Soja TaxID=1462606 RepID=A0A0R0HB33_SOYBN|nr:hypothetical protein GYH30_033437 [Glycine max]RZB41170.1 hypothetical protein D0Y65_055427 [Glycine soja]RZB75416.1 hypothetical protein D0Y65_034039 [Glycine soja]